MHGECCVDGTNTDSHGGKHKPNKKRAQTGVQMQVRSRHLESNDFGMEGKLYLYKDIMCHTCSYIGIHACRQLGIDIRVDANLDNG